MPIIVESLCCFLNLLVHLQESGAVEVGLMPGSTLAGGEQSRFDRTLAFLTSSFVLAAIAGS